MQPSSASEEIHQYRCKNFGSYIVCLSFQRTELRVRNCFTKRLRRLHKQALALLLQAPAKMVHGALPQSVRLVFRHTS